MTASERPERARKIILDCDPGHDDAVAILLAHGNPNLELLAITTVAGNQTLEKVTANARAVAKVGGIPVAGAGSAEGEGADQGGRGIRIAAGADRPLVAPQIIPEEIHGESGLDGPQLPSISDAEQPLDDRHAVNLIANTLRAHEPNTITLVATGSLTNLALFARMYPQLVNRVEGVTLMGGGHHTGNMTPAAEFNILADPEAAKIVFEADWPVTMVGLDVTHQVLATPDRMAQLIEVGTDVSRFIAELVEFFGAAYMKERHYPGPPMHDPLAVAAVADPSVLRTIRAGVQVETRGEVSRGATVVDLRRTWGSDRGLSDPSQLGVADDADAASSGETAAAPVPQHYVAVGVDQELFWQLLSEALHAIGDTGFAD